MTGEERQEWWRRKAVCCFVWGCPPWEFDAAWSAGRITLADVQMAVIVAVQMAPVKADLMDWITPGVVEELEEAAKAQAEARNMEKSWAGLEGLAKMENGK